MRSTEMDLIAVRPCMRNLKLIYRLGSPEFGTGDDRWLREGEARVPREEILLQRNRSPRSVTNAWHRKAAVADG